MSAADNTVIGQRFNGLETLHETVPRTTYEDCEFEACQFVESRFDHCKFVNCRFNGCVLSAVVPLDCRVLGVKFSRCKVIGIDWAKAQKVQELEFVECLTSYSNFKLLEAPGLKMRKCEVHEVQFNEADLSGADFRGSDLAGSIFFKTNLTGADFRDARNYNINVKTTVIKAARFRLPEALSLLGSLEIFVD